MLYSVEQLKHYPPQGLSIMIIFDNVSSTIDPAKCTVDLTALAEVGKPYVGTLTTRLSNGKPNNRKCKVTCHIKSLCKSHINCAIDNDGPGRYSFQYTPTIRERHELTMLINGQCSRKSLPCICLNPSTQLGRPVKITWTGLYTLGWVYSCSDISLCQIELLESLSTLTSTAMSTGSRLLPDLLCSCIFCCIVFLIISVSILTSSLSVERFTHCSVYQLEDALLAVVVKGEP